MPKLRTSNILLETDEYTLCSDDRGDRDLEGGEKASSDEVLLAYEIPIDEFDPEDGSRRRIDRLDLPYCHVPKA